jgi:DNA-binding NtrC family response regulator
MSDSRGPKFSCLLLEDDPRCAALTCALVEQEGGEVVVCTTVEQAQRQIELHQFDLFLLDQGLPDGTGGSFYFYLRNAGITSTVIMLTGLPDVTMAVELTRNGLFDYLTKPLDVAKIVDCLRRALCRITLPESGVSLTDFVGRNPRMRQVRQQIQDAAANPQALVLLMGETGVGKDLTARIIHQLTFQEGNSKAPFVALNCATLPAEMFEAELFGAERGAYTGAHQQRLGLIEAATGGTLFLDEIGEIPLLLQAKLLQFIETTEYRRLGSVIARRFSGRIIAATNRSLDDEVNAGRFRADLKYRLDVFPISLMPLRERKEDIGHLSESLLTALCEKHRRAQPMICPEEMTELLAYDFPGNIRELRNILERSLFQTPPESHWLALDKRCLQNVKAAKDIPRWASVASRDSLSHLEAQEYKLIRQTLREENGVIRRAAMRLGITHQSLLRRLKKWPELRPEGSVPQNRIFAHE